MTYPSASKMHTWFFFACKDRADVLGGQGSHVSLTAEEGLLQGMPRIHI